MFLDIKKRLSAKKYAGSRTIRQSKLLLFCSIDHVWQELVIC